MLRSTPGSLRVEICGGIASGKTTLAEALAKRGFSVCLEDFGMNPFWRSFYLDSIANAFDTEICFLLQHYHSIKEAERSKPPALACDYSLPLDRAYASTTLTTEETSAFLAVYGVGAKRLSRPSLTVHLRCDAEVEHRRIVCRGREVERTATLDLLVRLNAAIEQEFSGRGMGLAILRIDSERVDFREDGADRERVVAEVGQAVQGLSSAG